jgi:hypothetical protein
MRAIASNGLPLKITAEWTENDYWDRTHPDTDDLTCVTVAGWLVRINGRKYPRGHFDGDDTPDWTYRYTPQEGNTEAGKKIAIGRALSEARLTVW